MKDIFFKQCVILGTFALLTVSCQPKKDTTSPKPSHSDEQCEQCGISKLEEHTAEIEVLTGTESDVSILEETPTVEESFAKEELDQLSEVLDLPVSLEEQEGVSLKEFIDVLSLPSEIE